VVRAELALTVVQEVAALEPQLVMVSVVKGRRGDNGQYRDIRNQ